MNELDLNRSAHLWVRASFILLLILNIRGHAQNIILDTIYESSICTNNFKIFESQKYFFNGVSIIQAFIIFKSNYSCSDSIYIVTNNFENNVIDTQIVIIYDLVHKLESFTVLSVSKTSDRLIILFKNCIVVLKIDFDGNYIFDQMYPIRFHYVRIEGLGEKLLLINNYNTHPFDSEFRTQLTIFDPVNGRFHQSKALEFPGIEWTHLINKYITTNKLDRIFVVNLFKYEVTVYDEKLNVINVLKIDKESWVFFPDSEYKNFHDSIELIRSKSPYMLNAKNTIAKIFYFEKRLSRIEKIEAIGNRLLVSYKDPGLHKDYRFIDLWVEDNQNNYISVFSSLKVNTSWDMIKSSDMVTNLNYVIPIANSAAQWFDGEYIYFLQTSQDYWIGNTMICYKQLRDEYFLNYDARICVYKYRL